jgi:hypothetical protein
MDKYASSMEEVWGRYGGEWEEALQQWRSLIAAKKRRQRRCMSEARRPERKMISHLRVKEQYKMHLQKTVSL